MPGAVFYESDEFFISAIRTSKLLVHYPAEQPYHIDVLPLIVAAYIISAAVFCVVEDGVDGAGMVYHVQPVADIFASAVDREGLFILNVMNTKREKLLGAVVRTIIIAAIRDHNR